MFLAVRGRRVYGCGVEWWGEVEMRQLQEQQVIGDGWTTEWEPCIDQPRLDTDKEWRAHVTKLNKEQKSTGSNLRYRSVEIDE